MKKKRQQKILELIRNHEIETQEELVLGLLNAGFAVTQATVSRDIRELGLTKQSRRDGKQVYTVNESSNPNLSQKYIDALRAGFISIDQAQNILVLKTVSGMAMAVGAALDNMNFREIAGCIAGDDTIMVAVYSAEDAAAVMNKILKLVR